jgi:hypothetical protein
MATRWRVFVTVFVVLLLIPQVFAQGLTVRGTVVDPSDAIVSKAKVLLLNLRTLETMQATTDSNGQFTFDLQKRGSYALIAGGQPCFVGEVRTFQWKRTPSPLKLRLKFDTECKFIE